jgi:cytidine deaminase
MDFPVEKLLNLAHAAREAAYAPYSGFRVGAALLAARGQTYKGCNVENASYGLTICAERVALFKAVSEGERDFAALAVITGTEQYCVPCGACLQVLAEFNPQLKIFMGNFRGEYLERRVAELLPLAFQLPVDDKGR